MSKRDDEWVARYIVRETQASEQCTAEAHVTYPTPQQHAERTAHLDWHRGYRAALRDLQKAWGQRKKDGSV